MLFLQRVPVGDLERVLLIRKGRFERMLDPGAYWITGRNVELEMRNIREMVFESRWADYLFKHQPAVSERYFTVVETGDHEVALVSFDGKVVRVTGPGQRLLFWKGLAQVSAKVTDARANPEVPTALVGPVSRLGRETGVTFTTVEEGKTGLLFLDGKFLRALAPGGYAFWNAAGAVRVDVVDLRLQTLDIAGQEILTKDKVSIRVNIWAGIRCSTRYRPSRASRTTLTISTAPCSSPSGRRSATGRWKEFWRRRWRSTSEWQSRCARKWSSSACASAGWR